MHASSAMRWPGEALVGKIRKVGRFTDTVRANRPTMADAWVGLKNNEWFKAPGSTQHHDRVLRRESMGQKMTPKDDVRNIRRGRK